MRRRALFFCVRIERQLIEPLESNPLFRFLVGLGMDDGACVFTLMEAAYERVRLGSLAVVP